MSVCDSPDASAGAADRPHVTIWPTATHGEKPPPPPPSGSNVNPAGNESRTVTMPVVGPDETFVTVMLNVVVSPTTVAPAGALVIARSGTLVIGTGPVVKTSFDGFTSAACETQIRLICDGSAAAVTFTASRMVTVVVAAIAVAREHDAMSRPPVVPASEQVKPLTPPPLSPTLSVSPIGIVSVTVIGPAADPGAMFDTAIE